MSVLRVYLMPVPKVRILGSFEHVGVTPTFLETESKMTVAELAAYIGAAAWLPQIAAWTYRLFVRPKITIVPDRYAEVGFTSAGPIFNVRMAFASDRKDAIIDGFELVVRHADGDTRTFRWSGLREDFSEIRDAAGIRQGVISRDQNPIALKIGTESLVEKFVRFQEPRYHETDRPAFLTLLTQFNFLKRNDPEYVSKTLASKELFELLETRRTAFWWKAGRYDLTIKLSSPRKFRLTQSRFAYHLTSTDIDHLRQNIEALTTRHTERD
jgi:hypothetical protein